MLRRRCSVPYGIALLYATISTVALLHHQWFLGVLWVILAVIMATLGYINHRTELQRAAMEATQVRQTGPWWALTDMPTTWFIITELHSWRNGKAPGREYGEAQIINYRRQVVCKRP